MLVKYELKKSTIAVGSDDLTPLMFNDSILILAFLLRLITVLIMAHDFRRLVLFDSSWDW